MYVDSKKNIMYNKFIILEMSKTKLADDKSSARGKMPLFQSGKRYSKADLSQQKGKSLLKV